MEGMKKMKRKLLIGVGISFFGIIFLVGASCVHRNLTKKTTAIPFIEGAEYVGNGACMECHEELSSGFRRTMHGRLSGFEIVGGAKGCEGCHGPGSIHIEEPDTETIISFSNITVDESSAICIKCHTGGDLMGWQGSEHGMSNVGCTSCHKIAHNTADETDRLLVRTEPDLCYGCHQDIKMKNNYPSHHPVKEGKMVCSDCHQAHGSFVSSLKTDERLNDLCFNCHSAKQGPFVFEHEPVVENCAICHDPHGSVANNLLKQNEPFLCLQCHQSHFHAGKIGDDDPDAVDIYGRPAPSNAHSWKAAFATKCSQCHSQVHGSDLPSQSVPGQGKALSR